MFRKYFLKLLTKKYNQSEHNGFDIDYKKSIELLMLQNGRIWSELLKSKDLKSIQDAEFKVFSQCGDDGIIQYLIHQIDIKNKIFIEFGVEDYQESNTRFLLMNDNWSGLIMDSSQINIEKIKKADYFWKYDLRVKKAFITAENINQLIKEEGFNGEIGLLHIDIDGNDYWIWKALEVVTPVVMIVEYNSVFGSKRAITTPYKPGFCRNQEHSSNLYFGSSLKALCLLAEEKEYAFIGSNSAGNNAYFVKKEFLNGFKSITPEEGYIYSKFRESRDEIGNLTFLRGSERENRIKGLPVYNTKSKKIENF